MSRKGNVGKCALYPANLPKGVMHSDVLRIRIAKNIMNPTFLCFQLRISKKVEKQIDGLSKGAIIAGINVGKFKGIYILIPPFPLQNQFAVIVEKVESLKLRYNQSLTELENFYGSLSQRAFNGELDLSNVPVEQEKQVTELHGEVKGISFMTGEQSGAKIYSEEELVKIIKSLAEKSFSFDSLIFALEKALFKEMPKYEEIKRQIYKMLEGANPPLSQTFDKVKKEIVMRLNI